MTKPPKYWNRAKKYLSKKDKVMKDLIYKYRDKTLTTRKDIFFSLCKSIIGQQISVAAANSVFKKFKNVCNGKINPKIVKKINIQKLKKCGLSRQKVKGIKELAAKFESKSFDPKKIKFLIITFDLSLIILPFQRLGLKGLIGAIDIFLEFKLSIGP